MTLVVRIGVLLALALSVASGPGPGASAETVSGIFAGRSEQIRWRAWFEPDERLRIEAWRDAGPAGHGFVVFTASGDRLLTYAEYTRRRVEIPPDSRLGPPTLETGETSVALRFSGGRYSSGSKAVAGIVSDPASHDVNLARRQARMLQQQARLVREQPRPVFRCRGNEPFWTLTIEGAEAGYFALASGGQRRFDGGFQWNMAFIPRAFEWRGSDVENRDSPLMALITEELCEDTMSDGPATSHEVRLYVDGAPEVSGCCEVAQPIETVEPSMRELLTLTNGSLAEPFGPVVGEPTLPDGPFSEPMAPPWDPARSVTEIAPADLAARDEDDWSLSLAEMLPAIHVCAARLSTLAPLVLKAWPMSQGAFGVRMLRGEGGRVECVVRPAEADPPLEVQRFAGLSDDDAALPGEGAPVFVFASGQPAPGPRQERAEDGDGHLLGWLTYAELPTVEAPPDQP